MKKAALFATLLFTPVAALASDIPEPMVFDLIRPLGAKKGEFEANVLAQRAITGPSQTIEWAPEIEYAIADGFAIELELPFEGAQVHEYKVGLQATLGTAGNTIHGLHYLGIHDIGSGRTGHTLLYVLGVRWSEKISTLSMAGVGSRGFGPKRSAEFAEICKCHVPRSHMALNHTTFYEKDKNTTFGLEVNFRTAGEDYILVMPQIHKNLSHRYTIQGGVGIESFENSKIRPTMAIRFITEF
jgi:hypothetical protein